MQSIDLHFPVLGSTLPVDHGYELYGALSRIVPELHDESLPVRIATIRGDYLGKGLLQLSQPRSRLRLPADRLPTVLPLAGKRLQVGGHALRLGVLVVWMTGQAQAGFVHNYTLNNTYNDSLGGPALANDGGSLDATGYTFDANQGLTLSSWTTGTATSANYGIEIKFSLAELSSWRKLIDFKDQSDDQGLYLLDGHLQFYDLGIGPDMVAVNTPVDVILTRDGSTDVVTGYLNGVQQFQFTDLGAAGVFSSTNNIMRFFEDDSITGFGEASGGKVTSIQISDNSPQAVPEPSTLVSAALGAFVLLGYGRRRRATA